MRVLHLVNKLDYGGVLRHVNDLVHGLEEHGVQGSIAAWLPSGHELHDREHVLHLPLYGARGQRKSFSGAIRSIRMLHRLIAEERIDILHMHSRYVTAIGAAAARGLSVGRVYTVHNDFTDLRRLPFYPFNVICPSEAIRQGFLRHAWRKAGADVVVVPHGVPERGLRDGDDGGRAQFLFLGRLEQNKRADLVLKAAGALNDGERSALLVRIAGSGPMDAQLRFVAGEAGLRDSVRFEGYVADVFELLRGARALVFPSDSLDSVGYVNLEAFSIGVPVVASDLPQLREVVRHGETGLLFPPGNAEALAGAMRFALEHPEKMAAMGRKAWEYVRARHSMEGMLEGTLRVYSRVVKE